MRLPAQFGIKRNAKVSYLINKGNNIIIEVHVGWIMVSASSKNYRFTFIISDCKKQIIENSFEICEGEIKGFNCQIKEFVGRKDNNIIRINEAFMAETGKMICDGAHIYIKKYRAKTATLWKTGESGTGAT